MLRIFLTFLTILLFSGLVQAQNPIGIINGATPNVNFMDGQCMIAVNGITIGYSCGATGGTPGILYFKQYSEKIMNPAPMISAGALTIDLTTGNIGTYTNDQDMTSFTVTGTLNSGVSSFVLYVVSNGASRAQTWGGSIRFTNGPPIFSSTTGVVDRIGCSLYTNLTTWMCAANLNFAAP